MLLEPGHALRRRPAGRLALASVGSVCLSNRWNACTWLDERSSSLITSVVRRILGTGVLGILPL